MRKLLLFLGFVVSAQIALATGDSLNYLNWRDTVFLKTDQFGEKVFDHQLAKKQTLFSLAKFYGLSLEEIGFFNPNLDPETVSEGQIIRIPIPNRSIVRKLKKTPGMPSYIPVYHIVQNGETFYRIAKVYFKLEVDTLLKWNGLKKPILKPGQKIFVGWLNSDGIPAEHRVQIVNPVWKECLMLSKIYRGEALGKKQQLEKGAAFWQKNMDTKSGDLLGLHREAKIGSVVEVKNPMNKRMVYVKIIGNIPEAAYRKDVTIVLNSHAATLLGAKDPRFFVHLKYWK